MKNKAIPANTKFVDIFYYKRWCVVYNIFMISIITTLKKLLFVGLVTCVAVNTIYAGTGTTVTRGNNVDIYGNPVRISWNVNNAQCTPSLPSYSSADDTIKQNWMAGANGSGSYFGVGASNFAGQKVTAVPGSYTFYCTVPNNSGTGGTCTGTPGAGVQNTCWDSAILTVSDCLPGSVWVPASPSCVVQICTANTQTTSGCGQTVTNGTVTHLCSSDGTTASGACTLTSCSNGTVISADGLSCVCPSGQNMVSGNCATPTKISFGVSPSTCSIANGQSSCPMTLNWNVSGSNGIRVADCSGNTIAGASNLSSVGSFNINVGISGACYRIYDLGTGVLMGTVNI